MGFHATVLLVNGAISLVFASVALVGSTIMIIAVVRNPLNVIRKPLHSIEDTGLVLSFLVGTVLLPHFGVTEILQGVKNKSDSLDFPSVVLLFTDFLIASKLALQLGINIERHLAYVHPQFHRAKVTNRATVFTTLLCVTFFFLFSCLSFSGMDEKIYYIVSLHVCCTCLWFLFVLVSWLTYLKLKNRANSTRTAPAEPNQLPQAREKADFERARNVLAAKRHLQKLAKNYMPLVISIIPWYIINAWLSLAKFVWKTRQGFYRSVLLYPWLLLPMFITRCGGFSTENTAIPSDIFYVVTDLIIGGMHV